MRTKLLQLTALALLVILAGSCKKESNDYYVRLTKNGAQVNYTLTGGEVTPDPAANKINLGIRGQTDNASEVFDLTIQVNGNSFSPGTYDSDNTSYTTVIDYSLPSGSGLENYRIDDAATGAPSRFIVTISSITDKYISGSFTGNYLTNFAGTSLPLTKGEFNVERVN